MVRGLPDSWAPRCLFLFPPTCEVNTGGERVNLDDRRPRLRRRAFVNSSREAPRGGEGLIFTEPQNRSALMTDLSDTRALLGPSVPPSRSCSPSCFCSEVFCNKNKDDVLKEKETIRFPKLAETYRKIAEEGAKAFYEGPLAQSLVDDIQAAGEAPSLRPRPPRRPR